MLCIYIYIAACFVTRSYSFPHVIQPSMYICIENSLYPVRCTHLCVCVMLGWEATTLHRCFILVSHFAGAFFNLFNCCCSFLSLSRSFSLSFSYSDSITFCEYIYLCLYVCVCITLFMFWPFDFDIIPFPSFVDAVSSSIRILLLLRLSSSCQSSFKTIE